MSTGPIEMEYRPEHVQIVRSSQHVRQSPGMYFGDTGANGLHEVLLSILNCNILGPQTACASEWKLELLGLSI
jgi:hypothetical protein